MLLTGLSYNDLYSMVKAGKVQGIPRNITINALNNFNHKYGKTPDILQMALPQLTGNNKGYMAPKAVLKEVGDRVEADFFQAEFNEIIEEGISKQKKTVKLLSHGEASGAYICVDVFSGYPHGWLVNSFAETKNQVKRTVDVYKVESQNIKVFAADQGILTQSRYMVLLPEVTKYLLEQSII